MFVAIETTVTKAKAGDHVNETSHPSFTYSLVPFGFSLRLTGMIKARFLLGNIIVLQCVSFMVCVLPFSSAC